MKFLYEVTGLLHNKDFGFILQEWKIVKAYPKFFDICSHERKVKRIYRDRIGTPRSVENNYEDGRLTYHAFCIASDIDVTQDSIVSAIKDQLNLMEKLIHVNQEAIKEPSHIMKEIPYAMA